MDTMYYVIASIKAICLLVLVVATAAAVRELFYYVKRLHEYARELDDLSVTTAKSVARLGKRGKTRLKKDKRKKEENPARNVGNILHHMNPYDD